MSKVVEGCLLSSSNKAIPSLQDVKLVIRTTLWDELTTDDLLVNKLLNKLRIF
jgi:hypothetical protein